MSKHDRRRRQPKDQPAGNPLASPPPGNPAKVTWFRGPWAWFLSAVVAVVVLAVAYKWWTAPQPSNAPSQIAKNHRNVDKEDPPDPEPGDFHGHKPGTTPVDKDQPDGFLGEFNQKDGESDKESGEAALTNEELEKRFQALVELNAHLNDLKKSGAAEHFSSETKLAQALRETNRVRDQFDRKSAALDKQVGQAKKARPQDAVPHWLAGEILLMVGGEPEEIYPNLKFAADHGLKRARLAGSLSHTQMEANQFADSYRTAAAALDQNSQDRYLWNAFARAAISNHEFEPVIARLTRAFPAGLPSWAKAHRRDAEILQAKWEIEQKIRRAEALANDLPRVRLVIEHRRFAKDPSGKPLTTIESTGREEVVLELFENEAPLTVANFIDLATQKFYDGTTFHLAVSATMVAGGDPNTKNDDPADDGAGGPGYVIPDEYQAAAARNHFRGSISMAKTAPHTAGSQFFFSLAPLPKMHVDGTFTVFGRIVQGQDVVDRITRGRTTRKIGPFGKIIPGDLLVSAEVLRKRPHEYRAVKERP
jgi:cyclophilin family peptidyl-prolyl cis-trans isomerase